MKRIKKIAFMGLLCLSTIANSQSAIGSYNVIHQPCNNDGIIAVTITSGLTPPLNFYYIGNGDNVVHNNINSLTDTLFGTSAITYIYVTDNAQTSYYNSSTTMVPPFSIDPASITDAICPNLTGMLSLTINGGANPASVQWFNFVSGSFVATGNPAILPPGEYSAIITDASGCTVFTGNDSSAAYTIQNVSGINFSVAATLASCTNGTASVNGLTGGAAPYTYLWSNGASTPNITGLVQGNYSVVVTDAQGCHNNASGYVSQSVSINVNSVPSSASCLQNDGSVISFGSGGTPPYTYLYSNGVATQTANGLAGGTSIYVTATDANGCTGTGYSYINTSTPISVNYTTTSSSCTAPTGSATLTINGGTLPYSVNWNTTPVLNGNSIASMPAGSYAFTVTDAAGCIRTGTVVIPPASIINASIAAVNPVCPATTGSLNINVSGTNPPFTYLWNTAANTPMISNVSTGNYSCIITDNIGCSLTKYSSLIASSPISIGLNTTPASCMYSSDGSILANPVGGTAPYSFYWSNGQTAATATNLTSGYYYVAVQDANGCAQNTYYNPTYVSYDVNNTSCYCTISGKVYADQNSNCIYDSGEQGIEHIMIHCSGFGYTFTDAGGNYFFKVPSGNYTLSESVQYQYPLAACQNNSIPLTVTASSGCTSTVNFANNINTLHDIHMIKTNMNYAIPGNNYDQALIIQNDGTVTESNIQLGYKHDEQLDFIGSSPSLYTQQNSVLEPNWYSVNSGFPSLSPGESAILYMNNLVPTNIPIGTLLDFKDTASYNSPISNWLNDFTPWNNVTNYQTTVIGSFDPNFKEVTPKGTGTQGYINTSDSVLDYVVHFQNTGSYYADKVVVIDTLDEDLDWKSLKPGYSDHNFTISLSENGVLKFTFEHINLDWEDHNYLYSKGLLSYSIKLKPALSPGTEIKNRAAIYFDYNAPVMTNQTLNTIQLVTGIGETNKVTDMIVYPNPATNELYLNTGTTEDAISISIYDLQGRLVQDQKINKNSSIQKLNISFLVNGFYFIELIKNDGSKLTKKIIKN
jgi:hypothetical protein